MIKEKYLGDGVYAVFDGWSIWLDCRAQPELSEGPTGHKGICLESVVFNELIEFKSEVTEELWNNVTKE